jgi:hypothetical protein
MPTITQIIADAYRKMVNPPQAVARPKWVPASITEENVPAFVQAVTEARKANKSIVKFDGKRYGITEASVYDGRRYAEHENDRLDSIALAKKAKEAGDHAEAARHTATAAEHAKLRDKYTQKETTNAEDDDKSKKIQDMDAENAPKQASDEVPSEVKEEDAEEIKMDNHDEKEKDAEEMQRIAASEAPGDKRAEMAEKLVGNQHKLDVNKNGKIDGEDLKKLRSEELVGNQHKLDVNKNGKIDGEDLKKLRGEEKEEDSEEEHPEPDADNMGGPSDHDADNKDEEDEDEKPKMTGEQTIASVAATYAAMVNENVAGDPHAHKLSAKANELTALAHSSGSDTHHEDAQHAHHLAAEHYRVYAHQHHDPMVRGAANIHHEFHRSMYNHHMLHLVSADQDREASDAAAKHYGKKSVEEGTAADASMVNENDEYAGDNPADKLHLDVPAFIRVLERAREDFKTDEDIHNFTQQLIAMKSDCIRTADLPSSPVKEGTAADAEAGPEVMDPVTQKAKDDADDETEIKDGVPGAAQDGGDKVTPADKPAAANSSAALPKVPVITAPVMTNESMTAIITRKNSDGSYDEVGMSNKTVVRGSHSNILKKAKEYAKGPHRVELFHGDRIGYGSPHKVIHSE